MKQGTGVVGELCKDVFIPKMVKVHQKFDLSYIKPEDIPGVVRAQLDRDIIASKIKPGMTIAITCGSRGVSNTALIIKTIASYVKEKGAKPFVFPAMGSHGGATPEGQTQIVNGYGVVEARSVRLWKRNRLVRPMMAALYLLINMLPNRMASSCWAVSKHIPSLSALMKAA